MTPSLTMPWWREPTKPQWFAFAAAWFGWVLDAFDFTIFLLVMPEIARELGVHTLATTSSIALTLVARLVGSFIAGAAADRWGRKAPLMVSIVWFALCDAAVAFAPSFAWILILRTLFGLGMGAEWTAGTTLAMESWPARSRGIASGVLQGSWAIGYLLAAIAFAIVLPVWGWRALFLLAAAPALLVLPIRAWVPESEEWKTAQGKRRPMSTARALASPNALAKLAWASATTALGFGAYYGLTGLYPTLLKTELAKSDGSVAWLVIVFNLGMLVGSVASGALAAKRGVRLAIALPALSFLPFVPLYVGAVPSLLPLGAFAGGALGVGFVGVVPMLLSDLFDAEVRARFIGLAYHVGAFFAALVPMAIALLASSASLSLASSITIVAVACELALVLLVLLRRGMKRAPSPVVELAMGGLR
jgi:SHS family lactate transporter-like MFS transporter